AYKLPHLIDKRTLVIVNSYSGNTEETLSAFKEAMNSDAQILCLASGGQIAGMAKEHGYNLIELPKGLQPRAALFFSLIPVVKVLWQSGLLDHANEMVDESAELISQDIFREKGEKLAQQLKDKIPIVYADESIKAVAMRWKTQANENAKMPAFYNTFSEMNHNELCQYPMLAESFAVIFLRDEKDHERIQKRFEICKDIIQNQLEEVWAQGVSKLARIASLIHIGDWYSYYLALLREKDPSPVDTIEGFKKKL
ncbi:bifunctional phosphoglucose/phosphomannose isomerase, partial [Candidatus Woesearchaeota archaeon]|nr:bifunctional phosphoglucose/phosphomannose isomerase [Candidatus Woesearchaeota archaeon]